MEPDKSELIQALSHENEPDCQVLQQLVQDSAALNDTFIVGEALSLAVRSSFFNSVRILLKTGVSPNIRSRYNGKTPLHRACYQQQTEIIRELLKYKADVNAEDNYKRTPLHEAAVSRNTQNMQILLQNGAMVNAVDENDRTPLTFAIDSSRDICAVQVLLNAGADVNVFDVNDRTPLHHVVEKGSPQAVRLLLRYKADSNIKDKYGNTPLHNAVLNANKPHEIIRELLKGDARLNSLNDKGDSPLYYAVKFVDLVATQELLRWGAAFEIVECLKSLERSASLRWPRDEITAIAQELLRYVFIKNTHFLESTRLQQIKDEKVSNILRKISSPECNLMDFQQACLSEVETLSRLKCNCRKSSIWGSINYWKKCNCDTHQAILKFLFSGRKSNFTDAFFYKLDEDFLLEVSLTLISYFAFKESKKRLILPWPCMKEIERYVSIEDAVSFLQSKQSEMTTSEFKKYLAFMKEESSVKSSIEINTPRPKRLRVS